MSYVVSVTRLVSRSFRLEGTPSSIDNTAGTRCSRQRNRADCGEEGGRPNKRRKSNSGKAVQEAVDQSLARNVQNLYLHSSSKCALNSEVERNGSVPYSNGVFVCSREKRRC